MEFHLIFGQGLDSARWSGGDASLGCQSLGLNGMRSFLESRLGIPGNGPKPGLRIAGYQRRLQNYYRQNPGAWGAEAFEKDSWSTAEQLLSWRDELIEGGWNPADYQAGGSERLDVLAGIEDSEILPGPSDRLREVLRKLKELDTGKTGRWPVRVKLAHPKRFFPPIWREILEELPKVVTFDDAPPETTPSAANLADLLQGKKVILLEGNSQAELARHLVRYLTAEGDKLSSVTLLVRGDTRVLDGTLHKSGFGAVGNISPSAARPSLAILTLFFSLMWKPIRVEQLYELIASPYLGIPDRHRLLNAVTEAPGIGSKEWNEVWDKVLRNEKSDPYAQLKVWLENPLEEKSSVDELLDRCQWLEKRLNQRKYNYPELGITVSALRGLKEILKQSQTEITPIQLARAIESVIAAGTSPADARREVTDFKIVTDPGMVEPTETLLWFDCVRKNTPRPTYWSEKERRYFEGKVTLDQASRQRELEAYLRNRALSNTRERVIFFVPKTIDGEEFARDLFLNEINSALDNMGVGESKIRAESLITTKDDGGYWTLADQTLHTQLGDELKYETGTLVADNENSGKNISKYLFKIKKLDINKRYRDGKYSFSHSQLKSLLRCPIQWIISHYLELKNERPVPFTDSLISGNLAHKVLEELVMEQKEENGVWDPETARKRAGELFDKYVIERGGGFNNKEREIERVNMRRTVVDMAGVLFEHLRDWKIRTVDIERDIKDSNITIAGYELNGRIDLLATGENGEEHILDLKNSGSRKFRDPKDEQYKTTVLQLAIYTGKDNAENKKAAFALIPKRRILEDVKLVTLSNVFDEAEGVLDKYLSELKNGKLTANDRDTNNNNSLDEKDKEAFPPECKYCDCKWICGKAIRDQLGEQESNEETRKEKGC